MINIMEVDQKKKEDELYLLLILAQSGAGTQITSFVVIHYYGKS